MTSDVSVGAASAAPLRLNLGCGRNIRPGWVNIDCRRGPGIDVVADLEFASHDKLPFAAGTVDEILLSHVIEHVRDTLGLMSELYRVAKPGAAATIRVPHGGSDDAWEDPTHVRAYFAGSWGYFSQPFHWRADYRYAADWQPEIVTFIVGHRWVGTPKAELLANINAERNIVVEMIAVLRKVYPARPAKRELQVAPRLEIEALPR